MSYRISCNAGAARGDLGSPIESFLLFYNFNLAAVPFTGLSYYSAFLSVEDTTPPIAPSIAKAPAVIPIPAGPGTITIAESSGNQNRIIAWQSNADLAIDVFAIEPVTRFIDVPISGRSPNVSVFIHEQPCMSPVHWVRFCRLLREPILEFLNTIMVFLLLKDVWQEGILIIRSTSQLMEYPALCMDLSIQETVL